MPNQVASPRLKTLGLRQALSSLLDLLRAKPRVPPTLADNPLLKTILERRSARAFQDRPLPDDVFAAILEAARLAPSTVNLQTWAFGVFDPGQWQQTFGRSIPFHAARAVIVIADTFRARSVLDVFPHSPLVEHSVAVMNASLAAMNMNIAAEALGVASVMLSETGQTGLLDPLYLKDKLGLPEHAIPILTIVFGYPKGAKQPMPPKLPPEQIFFSGRYSPPDAQVMGPWLSQMRAGYQASHLGVSLESQLRVYQSKIGQAEEELRAMIIEKKA